MRTGVVTATVLLSAAVLAGCKGPVPGQPTPTPSVTSTPTTPPTTPPVEPTPTPTPTDPATTPPTTPPLGDDQVSIKVQIPERTAPPAGD